jgi:hypothetical protein
MLRKSLFILSIFLVFAGLAFAQNVYTPAKDSPERKAVLDALRVPVERDLKKKTTFAIDHFKIQGSWAFLYGKPRKADGSRMDYRGTKYQAAVNEGMFDDNFFALLRKTGGKWKVATFAIGCTDVCYATWWRDHKAPKTIFPYTE